MTDLVESQRQKRALTPEGCDTPLAKISKISENGNKQQKFSVTESCEASKELLDDHIITNNLTNEHAAASNGNQTERKLNVATALSSCVTQSNLLQNNVLKTSSVLSVPSTHDTQKLNCNIEENMSPVRDIFGTCMICKMPTQDRSPLLLGCLHSYCADCILQREFFRISHSDASKPHQNRFNGPRADGSLPETSTNLNLSSIPNEAFQTLANLKQFIANNNSAVGRLVVKCQLCECNTRAKVITENKFSSIASTKDNVGPANVMEICCTNCDERAAAIRFCKECDEHLCEECVNAHRRVKLTKEHTLTVLEGKVIEGADVLSMTRFCKKHANEEIRLFCETCSILTCRDCQLESHRDHKYMFIKEAAESQAKILESMRLKLNEKKFFLDQTSSLIKTHLSNMFSCRDNANKDITSFHRQLQDRLTAKCQFFLNKIDEVTSLRQTKLNNQLHATTRLCAAVDHCLKFIDFAREKQNGLALLEAKQMILEYMTTVMRQKFTTNPVTSSDIVFLPDKDISKLISCKLGSLLWGQPASNLIKVTPNQQNSLQNCKQIPSHPHNMQKHNLKLNNPAMQFRPQQRHPMISQMQPTPGIRSSSNINYLQPGVISSSSHNNLLLSTRVHSVPSKDKKGFHPTSNNASLVGQLLKQPQYDVVRENMIFNNNVIASASIQEVNPVRRSSYGSQTSHIQENHMKPFVSKVGLAMPEQLNVSAPKFNDESLSSKVHPTTASSTTVPAIVERVDENSTKTSSFLREVTAMSHQQVIPNNECSSIKEIDNNASHSPDKTGCGNAGSTSGEISDEKSSTVDTSDAKDWWSTRKPEFTLSPPPLIDLTDIVKIEEEQQPKDQENKELVKKEIKVKEENVDDDSDVEKMLQLIVQENKKKFDNSDDSGSEADDRKTHEHQKNNICGDLKIEKKYDPNEDWCAVCNNGGDLLCCDTCPKVFHLHCHVPEIISAPPGTWQCTLCTDIDKLLEADSKYPKRKRITGLMGREIKICEKLLLELFCHSQSTPFHLPVRSSVPNYHKVIKEPMDLSKIKKKLLNSNFNHYENEKEFVQDVQLLLTNCFTFNGVTSPVGKMGQILQKYFIDRLKERFPIQNDYLLEVVMSQNAVGTQPQSDVDKSASKTDQPALKKHSSDKTKQFYDKTKQSYENDCLWEPGHEEEEEESLIGTPDVQSEDDLIDDVSHINDVNVEKRRKQCKSGIIHIK